MQRKCIFWGMVLMAGLVISGCANNREIIARASHSTQSDVFVEIANSDALPEKAIADIKFSVKSNCLLRSGSPSFYGRGLPPLTTLVA